MNVKTFCIKIYFIWLIFVYLSNARLFFILYQNIWNLKKLRHIIKHGFFLSWQFNDILMRIKFPPLSRHREAHWTDLCLWTVQIHTELHGGMLEVASCLCDRVPVWIWFCKCAGWNLWRPLYETGSREITLSDKT